MEIHKTFDKKLLLANTNETIIFQKKHIFLIANDKMHYNFNELISLDNYIEIISKDLFEQIKLELNISKSIFGYRSSDNLELYVNETLNNIYIFSIGETPHFIKYLLKVVFLDMK